ncbi:hypothetical protein D5687_10910 [Guyparkeria sp. SCN-R1]|uniref:hypothetical protein n=1 Tax=Guyparkeria sp. SCN-R1 TaxID=2341113 RepID=UPI000F654C46|nr:hypothetical protein [Guyparkeria sp. SCN-R1]RRQ20130.1 hypothetical protein D5687_10910 [Guyparkeria sp. SCN-R1]
MTEEKKPGEALEEHLKNWQEIGSRMQALALPALKKQLALEKSMRPELLELQKSIRKSLEPVVAIQNEWQALVAQVEASRKAMPDLGVLAEQVNSLRKALAEVVPPALSELQRSFKELPPKTQDESPRLS